MWLDERRNPVRPSIDVLTYVHRSTEGVTTVDKVAIITGGGTGLGADIAQTLADDGMSVVLNGRREDKLNEVVDKVRAGGGDAVAATGDIADTAVVQSVVEVAARSFGPRLGFLAGFWYR